MKVVPLTLLVDDSEPDLFVTKHLMAEGGRFLEVKSVEDGQHALEFFLSLASRTRPLSDVPNLVLLDLNIPRLDGFSFLQRALEQGCLPSSVNVVLVSSSTDPGDVVRSRSFACIRDFLVKPVSPGQLITLADTYGEELGEADPRSASQDLGIS